MRILIAPNAFKNSVDAAETAKAIQEGFSQSRLSCSCTCFPVGDGGDGTAELLANHLQGRPISAHTVDALGRKLSASFSLLPDQTTAIIEMAGSSGLRQLKTSEYDPLIASTYGTGKLIVAALDQGAKKLIIGIGGSATVDGATGMLRALGVRFLDGNQQEISAPGRLSELTSVDITRMDKRIGAAELVILCDVENRLLGDKGAAAVFGPQKGATPEATVQLEKGLQRLRDVIWQQTGFDMGAMPHGGAAGGTAAGLAAMAGARLVNGIDYFLQTADFEKALGKADLVITAEGSLDEQTLEGKAPFGVAKMAKEKNLPVIGLGGRVPGAASAELDNYFDALLAINNGPTSLEAAIQQTSADLTRVAKAIGNILACSA